MTEEDPDLAMTAAERAISKARANSRQVAAVLNRTAQALAESAALAESHALREAAAGREDKAEEERRAAARARAASHRAEAHAARCLEIGGERQR